MSLRSTSTQWGIVARWLHWLGAAVILFALVHGYWMANLLQPRQVRLPQYILHSTVLIYFALIVVLRIVWRLSEPTPAQPKGSAGWEKAAAHAGHFALYAVLIAALVTGYMNWSLFPARFDPARVADTKIRLLGFWELPALHTKLDREAFKFWEHWHTYVAWAMAVLLVVHVAAAMRHHFVKRNNVLTRMLRAG